VKVGQRILRHQPVQFARDPTIRISDIARSVGVGERAAQKIIADLVEEGFLMRSKEGRRNRYEVNRQIPAGASGRSRTRPDPSPAHAAGVNHKSPGRPGPKAPGGFEPPYEALQASA
jgi:hypothetical protein